MGAARVIALLVCGAATLPLACRSTSAGKGWEGINSGGGASGTGGSGVKEPPRPLEDLQRAYVDLRFGMFIHFGILTYTGSWAQANLPISMFNPTLLDPGQWADAAIAAHMRYGVLTTRHHDGFALWNSAASSFDVGSIPWASGRGDVVRQYVDAFRAKGLLPGLYYSVWDSTQGVGNGAITRAQIDYVKTQLTELLTNYGPIPILVFDGWSWKMGHQAMPYQEIRELVKSLQPNCLMLDHTHLMSPWDADVVAIEEPKGAFASPDNTYPATQGQKINATGGNDWFWAPSIGNLMTVTSAVDGHLKKLEPVWTNFLLNCPPNRDGLLDDVMVGRLAEIGAAFTADPARPPLPAQGPQNEHPYTPIGATATSGTASYAVDGINNWGNYTVWQSAGDLPQAVTIDLGQARPDVGFLGYVPRYVANLGATTDGAITSYAVATSVDGATFSEATNGTWEASGKMKSATFGPVLARFVRLEARAVVGASAAATEITVGAVR
jgi:alpha-L-fucosidase